jgi:hypothetical protein
VQANALRSYSRALESCTAAGDCGAMDLAEAAANLEETGLRIHTETAASKGIIHALAFDYYQPAPVPSRPAAYGANWLILFGSLIGFGAAALASRLPNFPAKKL